MHSGGQSEAKLHFCGSHLAVNILMLMGKTQMPVYEIMFFLSVYEINILLTSVRDMFPCSCTRSLS